MSQETAEHILATRRAKQLLAPLGAAAPATPAEGYRLQYQVATKLGAVPPAGLKIGATTKQMQTILGLTGPAGGFVPKEGLRFTPASFRFADFLNPGVECEVGLRLGQDLPHGAHTRESVAAAVAEVFPAIEIVENRYGDFAAFGTPSLIADQVFHAAGVLGAPTPNWRALDLGATRGRMTVAGTVRGEGVGADLLGHPMEALAWLAGSDCAREFGGLKAGQVVFLGSVTPPIWLDGPCDVLVEFDTLGKVALTFT